MIPCLRAARVGAFAVVEALMTGCWAIPAWHTPPHTDSRRSGSSSSGCHRCCGLRLHEASGSCNSDSNHVPHMPAASRGICSYSSRRHPSGIPTGLSNSSSSPQWALQQRQLTSATGIDDFITKQLMSCSSVGVLRRVMLRYKSNMEPDHVATLLLVLQHLVHLQRARQQQQHQQQGVHGRVTASREFSRTTVRAAERDGPLQQLLAQMMGEAGAMIWQSLGDMRGPDLAKVLFSWAALDWQPEPQLYAQVSTLFLQAASASGGSGHTSSSAGDGSSSGSGSRLPDVMQGPAWLAAGLWGLAKLSPVLDAAALALLQQHWPQLVTQWTPQQLTDIATAVVAATESFDGDGQIDGGAEKFKPVVLGLAAQLAQLLQQQQAADALAEAAAQPAEQQSIASSSAVAAALAWPAVLVAAHRSDQGQRARGADAAAQRQSAGQARQLSWRMLQALAAVGLDVDEAQGPAKEVVLLLSQSMVRAAS